MCKLYKENTGYLGKVFTIEGSKKQQNIIKINFKKCWELTIKTPGDSNVKCRLVDIGKIVLFAAGIFLVQK